MRQFVRSLFVSIFVMVSVWISTARAGAPSGLADTPWPMFQRDPSHSGQSDYLSITSRPMLLWQKTLPIPARL